MAKSSMLQRKSLWRKDVNRLPEHACGAYTGRDYLGNLGFNYQISIISSFESERKDS